MLTGSTTKSSSLTRITKEAFCAGLRLQISRGTFLLVLSESWRNMCLKNAFVEGLTLTVKRDKSPNPRFDTDPSQRRSAPLFRAGQALRSAPVRKSADGVFFSI